MIYFIISTVIFAADQLIKTIVPRHQVMFIINYTENTGAAFGILREHIGFLIFIGLIIIGVICYFLKNLDEQQSMLKFGLSFILGGSVANVSDRIMRGYVIDYIDFKVWPVFNLADICINFGLFLIIVKLIFWSNKQKCQNS